MPRHPLVAQGAQGARLTVDGRALLSFASFNYLGLHRHPAVGRALQAALQRYGISLAMPRSLATNQATILLEAELATLAEQEGALLFPSTTHAALDAICAIATPGALILVDQGAYTISRQGVRLACAGGAEQVTFPHNNLDAVRQLLMAQPHERRKLIVCDGAYPAEGKAAPVHAFAALAHQYNAILYVDDAHGFGILGAQPTASNPFGHGGGGVCAHQGVHSARVLYVSSLSKAFGVPVAFAAGSTRLMRLIKAKATSLVHCSPPALPLVAAARTILRLNQTIGDDRRQRILENVRLLQQSLRRHGLRTHPQTLFPVQNVKVNAGRSVQRALRAQGIHAIVQCPGGRMHRGKALCPCVLRIIVTADHTPNQLTLLANALSDSLESNPPVHA